MKKGTAILAFTSAVVAAGAIGGSFNPGDPDTRRWYDALDKPPFNPPDAVFPIVWTTLYALMVVSAYRVWRGGHHTRALTLWALQLVFNAIWNPLFFGAKQPAIAMADLLALLAALAAYTRAAARTDRPAAALMIPYLAWVAFAGAINFEIVRRN